MRNAQLSHAIALPICIVGISFLLAPSTALLFSAESLLQTAAGALSWLSRPSLKLSPVSRALSPYSYSQGCPCSQGPPGGKCCEFIGSVPPLGSAYSARCQCRTCRPAYRCVSSAASKGQFCIFKTIRAIPKCIDPMATAQRCHNVRTNFRILVPYTRTPTVASRPMRPSTFDLFVAGHMQCDIFQGGNTAPILTTSSYKHIYEKRSLRLERCAPIRLRCRDTSHNRMGVLVALRAGGRFFGTGLSGTVYKASAYQPRRWHSDSPEIRDEKEIVTLGIQNVETWREISSLTGTKPIRARIPFRSIYTYVTV